MTDPRNQPKIVQPTDEPIFGGEDTAKADVLETVVSDAFAPDASGSLSNWQKENMVCLAEKIAPYFKIVGASYNSNNNGQIGTLININISDIKELLPYLVNLDNSNQNVSDKCILIIKVQQDLPSETLCKFLEKKYGTVLAQTGIYEASGLMQENTTFEQLEPYFTEMKELKSMKQRFIPFQSNPYLSLLGYPVEVRPFFTGAIMDTAIDYEPGAITTRFNHPLSLAEIIKYAQKVNEVPKVAEYMRIMNELKAQ